MRTVRCNVCLDRFEEPSHYSAEERHLIRLVTQGFTGSEGCGAHLCPECIAYFGSVLRRPEPNKGRAPSRRSGESAIARSA